MSSAAMWSGGTSVNGGVEPVGHVRPAARQSRAEYIAVSTRAASLLGKNSVAEASSTPSLARQAMSSAAK